MLVFVTRKVNSEELAAKLRRCDYSLGLLHGDMSQFERNEILTNFKKQQFRILVATDVAGKWWKSMFILGIIYSSRDSAFSKFLVYFRWQ